MKSGCIRGALTCYERVCQSPGSKGNHSPLGRSISFNSMYPSPACTLTSRSTWGHTKQEGDGEGGRRWVDRGWINRL